MSCCPVLFTGTKRMVGRIAASKIASASVASFFAAGSDKQSSPMVCTGAGFHCNRRWREILYRFDELCAADLSRDYHAICIDPIKVEGSLSEIDCQEFK